MSCIYETIYNCKCSSVKALKFKVIGNYFCWKPVIQYELEHFCSVQIYCNILVNSFFDNISLYIMCKWINKNDSTQINQTDYDYYIASLHYYEWGVLVFTQLNTNL